MAQYAVNQQQGFINHIKNVAVVGAGGTVGSYIVRSLLAQGKHTITALTRADGNTDLPSGIHSIQKVDYNSHISLVSALQSQEALIITMNNMAPKDSQTKLIDAAVEAGVNYIMPNEYSTDYSNASLAKETIIGTPALKIRQ